MVKEIPNNWVETELKNISIIQSGGTPARGNNAYWNGNIPWVKISDLKEFYVRETKEFITEKGLNNSSTRVFPEGTILFTIFATIGKVGVLKIDAATNQAIAGITPSKKINSQYLTFSLIELSNEILGLGKGVAQKNINQTILKNTLIPLPPLAEQERIVAKLDSLFARLDKIKYSLKNLISIKKQYVYSCLVNPDNKEFYTRKRLEEFLQEGTQRIGDEWINCRKVGVSAKKGIIDLSTGQKKTFEKYKVVRPGDFIYNTMRVNIGSIAIYNGVENAITSPDYVVFRVENHLSPELLLGFLKSDQGLLEIGANTKGSVRARLYFKSLSQIRMPVSDEKTQILAEKFLHEFSKSIKKLKKLSKTHFDNLSQSILQEAFKGELVPQLESDGDSRELLREIEELKAGNILKKTSGRRKTIKDFGKEYALDQERQLKVEEGKETYKK